MILNQLAKKKKNSLRDYLSLSVSKDAACSRISILGDIKETRKQGKKYQNTLIEHNSHKEL